MKRETYIEKGQGELQQNEFEQNSQAVTKGKVERDVRRDSAGRFFESANQHMLRALGGRAERMSIRPFLHLNIFTIGHP